jgi:predicted dehydrogenase
LKVFEVGKRPRVVQCKGPDGYQRELEHMVDAILAGTPPSVVSARDGQSAVEICEAEERSVKSGQVEPVLSAG